MPVKSPSAFGLTNYANAIQHNIMPNNCWIRTAKSTLSQVLPGNYSQLGKICEQRLPKLLVTQTFRPSFFFFVVAYVYFPFAFTFSGLTKEKFLNISLVCLVLNVVIFVKRRTR